MKRQNVMLLIMVALVAGLLGSCDALFENQFKAAGLGQVTSESLGTSDAATLIEASGLEGTGISQSFIDAALSDPAVTEDILKTLSDVATDPDTPTITVQTAEALIIEIKLVESGGKALMDNLIDAIATIDFNNFDPFGNPEQFADFLAALFPEKAIPAGWTKSEIRNIIDEIYYLGGDLETLANTLDLNGRFEAAGINAGWLAQVGTIVTILHEVAPAPGDSIGEALANVIEDPEHYDRYINLDATTIANRIKSNPTLLALFGAAGLDIDALASQFGA